MSEIKLYNIDCMEFMRRCKDKEYELAICDPPYMDGNNKALNTLGVNRTKYNIETFSNSPKEGYFKELLRVSKNQIIWGGNYFANYLPNSRCWLMWDKIQSLDQFADFELAWTSFDKVAKKYKKVSKGGFLTNGTIDQKIHPTQKPVGLYSWILRNYATPGDYILDTHLGSGSIAIACHLEGFDLTGCEIDLDYYNAAVKRFELHTSQLKVKFDD